MFSSKFLKRTAVAIAVVAGLAGVNAPRVQAMTIPTAVASNAAQMDRQADLASIQTALESKQIRQRLADLRLSPAEINTRLAGLNDQQIHKLALQADKQNAAADAGATILIVIAAIALLALIISLLKGHHHDDDHHDAGSTNVNTTAQPAQPAQTSPSTIIVK
jgi:hypothetical protein